MDALWGEAEHIHTDLGTWGGVHVVACTLLIRGAIGPCPHPELDAAEQRSSLQRQQVVPARAKGPDAPTEGGASSG